MMVYRRKGRSAWFIAVPTAAGGRVKRSTQTSHRPTARAMERMLEELGPHRKHAWDLLERVADGSLSLPVLFDAYAANDLDGLRARLDDVDLTQHIAPWEAWIADRVKPSTVGTGRSGARY
jgi:hypothetical protein